LRYTAGTVGAALGGIPNSFNNAGRNNTEDVPQFETGGYTGPGNADDSFLAELHYNEVVVGRGGQLVQRDPQLVSLLESFVEMPFGVGLERAAPMGGGGGSTIINTSQFGDVNVAIPEGTDVNDPFALAEVVMDAIEIAQRNNPPRRNGGLRSTL
jgi:hypothetical protein